MIFTTVALGVATCVVLAPGWLLARTLGVRSVSASLAWALVLIFGALMLTFALGSTLSLAVLVLAIALLATLGLAGFRGWPKAETVPGRWWALFWGAVIGGMLWFAAPSVQGDGLFHLARIRKLVELDTLSLSSLNEFVDGSLHPGYAFPLWHGFDALVARVAREDPEVVVRHLPTILAPIAVLVAYEAGWALFRRPWAAAAAAAAQVGMICFAPGQGGAYVFLALPATSSRQILVPAALALALETMRAPSLGRFATTAAAGLVLAVVHPTYAVFMWLPFVGFLVLRFLWERRDLLAGSIALAALVAPALLFFLWLLPTVRDTRSVTPDRSEVERAFAQYPGQLNIRSDTSYSLAAEVFTRSGAIAIGALLLIPLAGLAARRRWAAFVVGGSLAVFAVTLVPVLFTTFSDVVSISQARRLAGFLPFAFAFAGGMGVLAAVLGVLVVPVAFLGGVVLQLLYPGDFGYVLGDTASGWLVWLSVVGTVTALVVGFVRRRPALEDRAGLAAALFLAPVFASGLGAWGKPLTPPNATLSPGLVHAVREKIPQRSIVYSDPQTSFRLAAYAPVLIAVAPPGNVADTEANRPYERAADARRFLRTGDLAIPESYGAQYLVVDRLHTRRQFDLPVVYEDPRFVLYRLPTPR